MQAHPSFKKWESIIHPTAVIASSSVIGAGSIFFPHSTVSVDTQIGQFGMFYIHSTICNDCRIGDYVSVMSGATVSERAEVESGSILTVGQIVKPHKKYCNKK